MTHPLVVTLDRQSAPRTIFAGDKLAVVDMPPGTRVIYPRPPLAALKDPDAAIRYALNHPENMEPLHALLSPGMKVTIAVDDISMPLPIMRTPDVRQLVLEIVCELLADHGVTNVKFEVRISENGRSLRTTHSMIFSGSREVACAAWKGVWCAPDLPTLIRGWVR